MKKFIEKKVMDYKFRGAGQGHRLDEEKPKPRPSSASSSSANKRAAPSTSSQAAGQAALARLEGGGDKRRSPAATASKAATKQPQPLQSSEKTTTDTCGTQLLDTVAGSSMIVNLVCPVCNRSVPYSEIHDHMTTCLQEEYIKEPLTASVQMIHSLCKDADRRKVCVETICKYLDNIIEHPEEEKYRKIRTGNKTFKEKVAAVAGADLFLEAVGFQQRLLPHQDSEQQFYVLPTVTESSETDERETERLVVVREVLSSSEPLKPTLDRGVVLYRPSPHVNQFDLSADFYQLSLEEIRREQKLKSEAVEQNQILRTKVMRERDEMRATSRYYRYTLLRIRLPDGLFIQAVFRPHEKLQEVRLVVSSALTDGTLIFSLSAFGQLLKNDSESLAVLGLVPSAVLNLSWVGAGPDSSQPFLDPNLLSRIQKL